MVEVVNVGVIAMFEQVAYARMPNVHERLRMQMSGQVNLPVANSIPLALNIVPSEHDRLVDALEQYEQIQVPYGGQYYTIDRVERSGRFPVGETVVAYVKH